MRWFVEGFSERSKIPVKLELDATFGRLPSELETTVFRIVQECLTNIHRHSGSPSAIIKITRDENSVTVEVQDYGKGLAPGSGNGETGPVTPGVGIQGMRERVRQLPERLRFTQVRKERWWWPRCRWIVPPTIRRLKGANSKQV